MYKSWCSLVLLVALVPLSGCGPSADTLMQQQIDQLNELADAIESGADQAKLDEIGQRMKQTKSTIDGLNLSDAQKKRLAEEYGEATVKATARLARANMTKMGGMFQRMIEGLQQGMQGMPNGFGGPPKPQ